jgi:hypothetical protein
MLVPILANLDKVVARLAQRETPRAGRPGLPEKVLGFMRNEWVRAK